MKLIGIILALLISANAWAEDVSVVWVNGKEQIAYDDAIEATYIALYLIERDTGLNLDITRIRKRRDILRRPTDLSISSRADQRDAWAAYFGRRGDSELIRLVIAPPLQAQGRFWLAGIARGICVSAYPVAVVNARKDDIYRTATAIAHELGHILGANHIGSDTIMSPDAIGKATPDLLHFDPISIKEIRSCVL